MKKIKVLSWAGVFVLVAVLVRATLSLAEAIGPVGDSMHKMSVAEQCLKGKLPRNLCGNTDSIDIADYKQGSIDGRKAMLNLYKNSADKQADLNARFDKIDQALLILEAAVKSGSPDAKAQALAGLLALRREAHDIYKKD